MPQNQIMIRRNLSGWTISQVGPLCPLARSPYKMVNSYGPNHPIFFLPKRGQFLSSREATSSRAVKEVELVQPERCDQCPRSLLKRGFGFFLR